MAETGLLSMADRPTDFVGCDLADRPTDCIGCDLAHRPTDCVGCDFRASVTVHCVSQAGDVTPKWPTCEAWH